MTATVTVGAALDAARRRLRAAGIEDASREARLLLGHAERCLAPEAARIMAAAVTDRADRRPMAQVLGEREFWSLSFRVTPATLDPRPDSETVVATVLEHVGDRTAPLRILDLGTGSGCLLLALLSEFPGASGIGIDISAAAITVAAANARALGLDPRARFVVADWDRGLSGRFDVIVCNPPYIPSGEIGRLAPEVSRFEPRGALDGGPDGLAAYRALAPVLARRLAAGGLAAVEIGWGQQSAVEAILAPCGLAAGACNADLAGTPRCLTVGIKAELTQRP